MQAVPFAGEGNQWGIAAVSAHFGVTQRTLRFYEELGILRPDRDAGRRRYAFADLHTLRAVLIGRSAGMSLGECRRLVDIRAGADERRRREIDADLTRLEAAIHALHASRNRLGRALEDDVS
jgi:DNA-binding transcriptional MerR regulator